MNHSIKAVKINTKKDLTFFDTLSYTYYDKYRYSWHGEIFYDKIKYPIIDFIAGIINFYKWYKIIWKDRNFDQSYILVILKHKLKLQRETIIKADSHYGIDTDIRDIQICINLIEKINDDYYVMEKYEYQKSNFKFIPIIGNEGYSEMKIDVEWEKTEDYMKLYKSSERKVRALYPDIDFSSKDTLSHYIGMYNQNKANKLLYKILEEKLDNWWT